MNEWNNRNGYAWIRTYLMLTAGSTLDRESTKTQMRLDCPKVERRLRTPPFVHRLKGARHANSLARYIDANLDMSAFDVAPAYEHPDGLEPW